ATAEFTSRLLGALREAASAPVGRRLRDYFEADGEAVPFAGARFETYRPSDPFGIEPADLIAVTFLSIQITLNRGPTPDSVLRIERDRDEISRLLTDIPVDVPLERLTERGFAQHLGDESSAAQLYGRLRD